MDKLNHLFSKLALEALNSELLQKHSAMLSKSGLRQTRFTGYNHYGKYNFTNDNPSIHAECDTLDRFIWYQQTRHSNNAKIRRKLKKLQLFIARLNMNVNNPYEFSNSAPCFHCLNTLKNYGIKKVVYTSDYGETQCKKDKPIR